MLTLPFILLNSCATNPVTGKKDLMLMSKSQEVAMGQQSDPEVIAFFGLYDDQNLQNFINAKGQEMVGISYRKDLKYQFRIVDSPVVNAFAIPGGYVYFTRGIMAYFNDEAQFAGVLGHEIGHISARHSAKQYSEQMLAQLGLAAGAAISPTFAQFADIAQQGVGLLFLKFSRDAESQADRLGVEYSTKIGYNAQQMSKFFGTLDRIGKQSGQEVPTFLSTHPDPADREVKVSKLAKDWQRKVNAPAVNVNRDKYLRMIDGIVFGEDPKQGFVENNMFYHPVMKFQFPVPSQWAVQNTPQQVQMATRDGSAMMMFTLAGKGSLENSAQQVLQQFQLNAVESRREAVNGLSALAVIADQQVQQGQQPTSAARALFYIIDYAGSNYLILGASAKANFNSYFEVFRNTMTGFSELTDQEKINREPERVRVKQVQQPGSLSKVFAFYNVPQNRYEELAILNGMNLNDHLDAGTLIKVVERSGPVSVKR